MNLVNRNLTSQELKILGLITDIGLEYDKLKPLHGLEGMLFLSGLATLQTSIMARPTYHRVRLEQER